jgi:hypothetical protein
MVARAESKTCHIIAAVQNYEWGLLGSHSLVAQLSVHNSGSPIEEEKPYAEVRQRHPTDCP